MTAERQLTPVHFYRAEGRLSLHSRHLRLEWLGAWRTALFTGRANHLIGACDVISVLTRSTPGCGRQPDIACQHLHKVTQGRRSRHGHANSAGAFPHRLRPTFSRAYLCCAHDNTFLTETT